ncbi:MAG TPA: biotin/lipoyl-containing protein [bacterium]|nr:biotin/lipoyl-containing protein [bacterium]
MAEIVLLVGDRRVDARVTTRGDETTVRIGGREVRVRLEQLGPTTWRVAGEEGAARIARSVEHAGTRWLHLAGDTLAVRIGDAAARRPAARRPESLEAPMPGAVTQVAVSEGEIVAAGQPIVIIEAMKMEHVIRAPHAGRVTALRVRQGEQVEAGAVVAELRAAGAGGSAERPE